MLTFTAALMTGGASHRMGVDKATLTLNGEVLWARQLRILRELSPAEIIVSARLKPMWCSPEISFTSDEPQPLGPLCGLVATLKKIRTTHLIVLAVDLPLMTSDHLQRLKTQARSGCGVVPQRGDFFEPLCAIYPVAALALAAAALAKREVSLHALIRNLLAANLLARYEVMPVDDQLYFNMNTPQELQALGSARRNL